MVIYGLAEYLLTRRRHAAGLGTLAAHFVRREGVFVLNVVDEALR